MAIRKIRENGDEVLRKKSKIVDKIDHKVIQLLGDLADTMYKYEGIGIAAPQVGVLKRIVVIDIGDGILNLINPEILSSEGLMSTKEGCLSVPGVYGELKRPAKVKVRALNASGEEIIIDATELLAQALCHEIDHLEGILFIDNATNLENLD